MAHVDTHGKQVHASNSLSNYRCRLAGFVLALKSTPQATLARVFSHSIEWIKTCDHYTISHVAAPPPPPLVATVNSNRNTIPERHEQRRARPPYLLQTLDTVPPPALEILDQQRCRNYVRHIFRRQKVGGHVNPPAGLHATRRPPDQRETYRVHHRINLPKEGRQEGGCARVCCESMKRQPTRTQAS